MKSQTRIWVVLTAGLFLLSGCVGLDQIFVGLATPTPIAVVADTHGEEIAPVAASETEDDGDPVHALMDQAVARWAEGDLEGALALATQAVKLAPNRVDLLRLRAGIRLDLGDASRALGDLQWAEKQGMVSPSGFRLMASIYYDQAAYEAAAKAMTQAITYGLSADPPENAEFLGSGYGSLAEMYLLVGDLDAAVDNATRSIDLAERYDMYQSTYILSFSHLIRAQARLGQEDGAGANLTGVNLTDASLNNTDLRGATGLSASQLRSAQYLAGIILSGLDLSGFDLSGVELQNVDLSGANLSTANLSNADLSYARLTDANLTGANLTNADLTGASGNPHFPQLAIWSNTTCPDGSNSDSNGLNSCYDYATYNLFLPAVLYTDPTLFLVVQRSAGF